jgi:transposase-like protein
MRSSSGSAGRTVTDVARELGISSENLREWVKRTRAAEAIPAAELVVEVLNMAANSAACSPTA